MNWRIVAVVLMLWGLAGSVFGDDAQSAGDDPTLITVEESLWGFDGTLVAQRFNPFSVRLKNSTAIPWQGKLTLHRGAGGHARGLSLRQSIQLGPNESRWFQFTPYIADGFDNWELVWGLGEYGHQELNSAPTGPMATVLVFDPDAVTPTGGILRRMPEELFPQSITGTSALRGLILAHTPFWQGARVRTLLEWLNNGGRLYLLHNSDGKYPEFPDSLKILNNSATEFQIGAGVVKRVPIQINDLDSATAQQELFHDDLPNARLSGPTQLSLGFGQTGNYIGGARHEFAFQQLRILALFTRPWLLIYLCVALYLLLLFPGCYRLGTEAKRVRWFYVVFLGGVGLFSLIFVGLGQVGGQERSRLRSTGVARHTGGGVYEIDQWTLACVKDEGEYRLELPGTGPNIASCEESDVKLIPGLYDLDNSAATVEMSSASTHDFQEKLRVSSPLVPPSLLQLDGVSGRLDTIQVDPGPDFGRDVYKAWLVQNQSMYVLDTTRSPWTLDRTKKVESIVGSLVQEANNRLPLWVWFYPQVAMFLPAGGMGMYEEAQAETEKAVIGRLEPLLIAEAFDQANALDSRTAQTPPGMVRIMILCQLPEDFRHGDQHFPDQRGALLFTFDIPDPTRGQE